MPGTRFSLALVYSWPLALLLLSGCHETPPAAKDMPKSEAILPNVVVLPAWLYANQDPDEILLVDARSLEDYEAGHIPGAVSLPVSALNGEGMDKRNLAPTKKIEAILSDLGVRMDQAVVVYDDALDYRPASRVFWAMEVHGHPAAAVLNGGLPEWQKVSPQSLQTESPALHPSNFVAVLRPDRLATKLQVLRASSVESTVVLDVRSELEYIGEKSRGARSGHIKGADHKDFSTSLSTEPSTDQCVLYDLESLRELYAELEVGHRVITYCNSGNRASVSYLVLRSLGFDVAVYDGGWLEWSDNPRLPIRSGLEP